MAQDLDERPGRIAAGAGAKLQGFLRRLDAWLHPDQIADRLPQRGIEIHEKINDLDRALGQARDIGCKARAERFGIEVRRELRLQFGLMSEGKLLGIGFDEKVERVDNREFGGEIDLDLELRHFLRKDEPRLPIAMRVLLPVHEMLRRRHLQRIGGDFGAAVRRRAQPDGLRLKHDRAVVFIVGDMMDGGGNGHVRWSEWRNRSASINGAPQNRKPPMSRRALILLQGAARYEACGIRPTAALELDPAIAASFPHRPGGVAGRFCYQHH